VQQLYVEFGKRRTHQLDPSLKAEVFEVTTSEGHGFVGVRFEHQVTAAVVREFRTGLARLEFIEKRAELYAERRDTAERFERVGELEVRFKRGNVLGGGEAVTVQFLQKARNGSEEWQTLTTQADKLKAAVHEGQKFERELGYTRRWHVIVEADSLARDKSGCIYARALRSFETKDAADEFLWRNSGLALYGEPQRRPFSKGDTIELWADAGVFVKGQRHAKTVEQQLGPAQWSRERMGQDYVVVRLDHFRRLPALGTRLSWEGTGHAANGEPEDFRVRPGASERDREAKPRWGLLERDPHEPGWGTLRRLSEERQELTTELGRLETERQAVTRDWARQEFRMDRDHYKHGHSM
jgi:hypothetical protein